MPAIAESDRFKLACNVHVWAYSEEKKKCFFFLEKRLLIREISLCENDPLKPVLI